MDRRLGETVVCQPIWRVARTSRWKLSRRDQAVYRLPRVVLRLRRRPINATREIVHPPFIYIRHMLRVYFQPSREKIELKSFSTRVEFFIASLKGIWLLICHFTFHVPWESDKLHHCDIIIALGLRTSYCSNIGNVQFWFYYEKLDFEWVL